MLRALGPGGVKWVMAAVISGKVRGTPPGFEGEAIGGSGRPREFVPKTR